MDSDISVEIKHESVLPRLLQKMNGLAPFVWKSLPYRVKRYIRIRINPMDSRFHDSANRLWMENAILPSIGRNAFDTVLFVGCAPYTWHYEKVFRNTSTRYVTTDIDPAMRIWGSEHHIISSVTEMPSHVPENSVDVVIMNGVFGFGVNCQTDMSKALESLHRILKKPGGILVLGWNVDVIGDPMLLEATKSLFRAESALGMPPRKSFPGETHVYDLLTPRVPVR